MIDRVLVFEHVNEHYPLSSLNHLGVGLGSGQWDRDTEFVELGSVVAGLTSESDLTSQDFIKLEATEGQLSTPEVMPNTINTVRRAILYRKLPKEAEVDPKIEALDDTLESYGIWGEEGKAYALGSGFLLTSFINGLDAGGFSITKSKAILRDQIEDVLQQECAGRTSYSAVGALQYLYRVMKFAKLHTPETRIKQIKRGAYLLNVANLELPDY